VLRLGPCRDKLDEAAKDDPDSEKNPAVVAMRKRLYDYDHMVPPVGDPK
jgi:hypothetical protein